MVVSSSRIMDEIAKEAFGREHGFEGNMIANERYREAMYDETGILYTKLTLLTANSDREKSRTFAKESLKYITKKLELEDGSQRQSLENLRRILSTIMTESTKIDTEEGLREVSTLNGLIKKNLEEARAQYYQVLKNY